MGAAGSKRDLGHAEGAAIREELGMMDDLWLGLSDPDGSWLWLRKLDEGWYAGIEDASQSQLPPQRTHYSVYAMHGDTFFECDIVDFLDIGAAKAASLNFTMNLARMAAYK